MHESLRSAVCGGFCRRAARACVFERLFDIIYHTAQIADRCTPPCIAPHRGRERHADTRHRPGLAIVGFGLIEAETGKRRCCNTARSPRRQNFAARLVQLGARYGGADRAAPAGGHRGRGAVFSTTSPPASPSRTRAASSSAPRRRAGYRSMSTAHAGQAGGRRLWPCRKAAGDGHGQAALKLKAVPRPDDAADALALAICHARSATSLLARAQNPVKQTV